MSVSGRLKRLEARGGVKGRCIVDIVYESDEVETETIVKDDGFVRVIFFDFTSKLSYILNNLMNNFHMTKRNFALTRVERQALEVWKPVHLAFFISAGGYPIGYQPLSNPS